MHGATLVLLRAVARLAASACAAMGGAGVLARGSAAAPVAGVLLQGGILGDRRLPHEGQQEQRHAPGAAPLPAIHASDRHGVAAAPAVRVCAGKVRAADICTGAQPRAPLLVQQLIQTLDKLWM